MKCREKEAFDFISSQNLGALRKNNIILTTFYRVIDEEQFSRWSVLPINRQVLFDIPNINFIHHLFIPGKLTRVPTSNDPVQPQNHRNIILKFFLVLGYKHRTNELKTLTILLFLSFLFILKWQQLHKFSILDFFLKKSGHFFQKVNLLCYSSY